MYGECRSSTVSHECTRMPQCPRAATTTATFQAGHGYARWLTGIERTAGIAMGLVCFPLASSTMPAHGMCAMRCCYIHLCSDAAGIIHQPADFPYGTPS